MLRQLANPTALALVILTGLVHGDWTGRWKASDELRAAVDRLGRVPQAFGDWQGRPRELDRRQLEIGEIAGYVARDYTNQSDGGRVMVLLVCGRPGPIAVHTPDICYGGIGYVAASPPAADRIPDGPPGRPDEFIAALFRKERADMPESLQIFWAWNAGSGWQAPDNPRLAFAPVKVLYKLYVVREVAPGEEPLGGRAAREFLRQFLPELDRALFPAPGDAVGPLVPDPRTASGIARPGHPRPDAGTART